MEAEEEDDDEDEDEQVESSKPCVVAAQTLNEMALHLPPEKVITPLLQWVEPAFKGITYVNLPDSESYWAILNRKRC